MDVLLAYLLPLVDEVPKNEDVKAGWVAFAIFIGLAVGVAVIGWALSRSLKKSSATAAAGGYEERPPRREQSPEDQG